MSLIHMMMAIMPGSISCKEVDEKLDSYMEGDLSGWDRFRFKLHFLICAACKAYAAGYAKTVGLIKSSLEAKDNQDADVPEDLIQAIIAQQSNEPEAQG